MVEAFQANKNCQAPEKEKKNRVDYLQMGKHYEQAIHKRNTNIKQTYVKMFNLPIDQKQIKSISRHFYLSSRKCLKMWET